MVDRFGELGWSVLATSRNPEKIANLAANVQVLAADVATAGGRRAVVEYVGNNWSGALDCLVNNAGYGLCGPLESMTDEQIREQIEVNFFSAVLLTQALLPGLRTNRGKIICLSSILGFVGMPLMSLYAGSKYALEGWCESLSYELEPLGVQVCLVEPAGFRTGFAQHMKWPASALPPGSPYGPQLEGFRANHARLSQSGKGGRPMAVVERIVELAGGNKMPLRVRVGGNAHLLRFLRQVLPQRLADSLIGGIYRRLMRAP